MSSQHKAIQLANNALRRFGNNVYAAIEFIRMHYEPVNEEDRFIKSASLVYLADLAGI